MLRFIEGGFNSDAHGQIKARIYENVTNKKSCILIVPEQQTVMAESELAALLPSTAPLFFEVSNFTRFANTVFRKLGGLHTEYASKVKKTLVMWHTLKELSPFLTLTRGRREISVGTVERAMTAIKEADALGFDPIMLASSENRGELPKRLRDKMSDLAKIMSAYKTNLAEKYADTDDDIALTTKKLKENPDFFKDTEFFIEGFTSFTVPQYYLISELIHHSDVNVCLTLPKGGSGLFEYSETARTHRRISELCDRQGADKKIIYARDSDTEKSKILRDVCEELWRGNGSLTSSPTIMGEEIRILEAKNPFEECEFVASDIRRRVMLGASYGDFAVITGNASDYDGILDTGLDKADIPYFSSKTTDLMSFEAVRMIFAALSAVRGFNRDDVIAYASCPLSGVTSSERDEFEIYVDKWRINGSRFTDGVVWNMNPDGFDNRRGGDCDEILARIDATRVKLITPLMNLKQKISTKQSIKEHAAALFEFLEELGLEVSLKKRAKHFRSDGNALSCEENLRLYPIICDALSTLVEVLGDDVADSETFTAQLKIVFAASEMGRIPPTTDALTVGCADMLRLLGKKHVYLIGVNYGKFPSAPIDGSYFSDKDKLLLAEIGIETESDSEIRAARALFSFSRAFSYATESVTVSYPRADATFAALLPSFAIENIINLTGGAVKPKRISDIPPKDKFYAPLIAAESMDECSDSEREQLKSALEKSVGIHSYSSLDTIENASLSLHLKDKDNAPLYLTQTRIDTFVSCPLKYFCKFTLSLSEGERASFGANNIGSYIHAILENFFSEMRRRELSADNLSESDKEDMIKRAARTYLSDFENELGTSKRMESALSRLYRAARPVVDGLCEEFKKSRFTPRFFELPISKIATDGPAPVEIKGEGGETIYIYGTIDRVDTLPRGDDVYVRVVDYKTGSKDFDPQELAEGKNLQMFLYLKSIIECEKKSFLDTLGVKEGGRLLPAGLIYVKTDISDKRISTPSDELANSEIQKAQKRMGMVLDDEEIMSAMGEEYLPVKLTKSGIFAPHKKFLFTEQSWQDLSKATEDAVGRIGHRIASGEIHSVTAKDSDPKSPCKYCAYKAFCRSMRQ